MSPRPTRAHGRPGTTVIPADWAADHARVLDGTHTAVVTITAPSAPRWDPALRRTVTDGTTTIYSGAASLTQTSTTDVDTAEAHLLARTYDVALPHDADGITETHRIHVDTCPGDPDLEGRTLAVDATALGTGRFARHVTATLT